MSKPLIFSLRPEPDCVEDVAFLKEAGIEASPLPMMAIKGDDAALDTALEALSNMPDTEILITSKQSARMLAAYHDSAAFQQRRIWCVGAGSAEILRRAGFMKVKAGTVDAAHLLEVIAASIADKKASFLWLSGADIAFDMEKELNKLGHRAERVIIYQSVARAPECQQLLDALATGRPVAAIAMSARTITLFAEMLAHHKMLPNQIMSGQIMSGQIVSNQVVSGQDKPILIVQSPALAERAGNLGFLSIFAEELGREALLTCAVGWAQRQI